MLDRVNCVFQSGVTGEPVAPSAALYDRRDPEFLAECHALIAALRPIPTLDALCAHSEWPALFPRIQRVLGTIRAHVTHSPEPRPDGAPVRAVQWNLEHGNSYGHIEAALRTHPELADADLLTLNEVDLGMARSGNRDIALELARALDRHAAWAPLFLETTFGRTHEDAMAAAGAENQESLFGLALLSRWPIADVRLVQMPSPERFQFDAERMIGRHVALIARIERPGAPFVAVSTHLEVHRSRAFRTAQMEVVLEALGDERLPIVIGGDFNTHTFDRGEPGSVLAGARVLLMTPGDALRRRLLHPDRGGSREHLFDRLTRAGFEWESFVDHEPTLQLRLERLHELHQLPGLARAAMDRAVAWAERRAPLRLDWFAGRGWSGGSGRTVTGLHGPGGASDHAPIVAEFQT